MGPTPEALALADFLIDRFGLTVERYLLAYALMEHIEREFGAELDAEDTTPQPGADAVRELVQRWRECAKSAANGPMFDGASEYAVAGTYGDCADELESLLGRGGA